MIPVIQKKKTKKIVHLTIIFLLVLSFLIPFNFVKAKQNTIIPSSHDERVYDGYTLFSPEYHTNTFLINKNQEIVHSWQGDTIQNMGVYLLENGDLVQTCFPKESTTHFKGGGKTGRVEIRDWDSTLLWEFEYASENYCLHHDIEILPNGNILMIAAEAHSKQEAIEQGRNPATIIQNTMWTDTIIEVEPTGSTGGKIVWKWRIWDHLIQDFDSTKENYGVIKDHPELLDINSNAKTTDWNHINSIDYNPKFDQILLSSKAQNEIWVIDHSTSTSQAAGHTGGRYRKGGDLLYRWGNPVMYDHGSIHDQVFFQQHDATWIPQGYPGEGNILVFNNGVKRPSGSYSTVEEIIPPVTITGRYTYDEDTGFGPESPCWTYEDKPDFFSLILSSAQRLPNGNTLICQGFNGRIFEINNEKEIVWEYSNPFGIQKSVFKSYRYSLDHSGISTHLNPIKPSKPSSNQLVAQIHTEYIFETTAVDPNGEYLFYQWDFNNGSLSEWMGPYQSGKTVNTSYTWDEKGIHTIKVRAKNSKGLISDWSEPLIMIFVKTTTIIPPWFSWIFSIFENIFEYNDFRYCKG